MESRGNGTVAGSVRRCGVVDARSACKANYPPPVNSNLQCDYPLSRRHRPRDLVVAYGLFPQPTSTDFDPTKRRALFAFAGLCL